MIEKDNIPKHWQVKKLGEVCLRIIGGGTPSTKVEEYWKGEIPWISSADIHGLKDITPRRRITQKAIENSATSILPKGGIIVVTRVGLGKLAVAPYDICFSQDSQGLILNEKIISQPYALICLSRAVNIFKSQSRGTTISGVTKKQLEELEIPIPPIPEQQAIVAKIEELLSDLENGKQQLQTAQQQLKVYRQSLLKAAFEGKLTSSELGFAGLKDDRINEKGKKEILKSSNPKNPNSDNLPKGWKLVVLKDVADKITDGEHFRPQTQQKGIPFLSAKDVRDEGVSFEEPLYISEETAKKAMQRCNPQRGDILIVSRGATVGRMCIVNTDKPFCLLGSVILIKVKKTIHSKLLNYILKSPIANRKMVTVSGATAQQAIYLRDIKNIPIPLPPLPEQLRIVSELESKLTVCDKIEETIAQALAQAETLRQSILKKAFEGRLVNMEREKSGKAAA